MNIEFKQIGNRNAQEQLHGYQESWMQRDGDIVMNYRGHCINNEDVGYQEYHRLRISEFCIR
jgi:hypothetical protein